MTTEQEPVERAESEGSEPILIVSRAELRARLDVIDGEGTRPYGQGFLLDPALKEPSFDRHFGVPVDPLGGYRTIDSEGVVHIIPVKDRKNL